MEVIIAFLFDQLKNKKYRLGIRELEEWNLFKETKPPGMQHSAVTTWEPGHAL